jgi:transcriptional regulator with XRE-family HTH domain
MERGATLAEQGEGGMPRLAAQLNKLFATVPRPDGTTLWTNESAASALTAAGVATSAAYLSQLRTGKRDNPSARHLAAIARLFQMPMEYFFDEDLAARIDADMQTLVALRTAGVENIALRAQGLSPASLSGVADMIEHIRRLEQGSAATPPPPATGPAE